MHAQDISSQKIKSYFCRTLQPQYGKTMIIILFLVYSINYQVLNQSNTSEVFRASGAIINCVFRQKPVYQKCLQGKSLSDQGIISDLKISRGKLTTHIFYQSNIFCKVKLRNQRFLYIKRPSSRSLYFVLRKFLILADGVFCICRVRLPSYI